MRHDAGVVQLGKGKETIVGDLVNDPYGDRVDEAGFTRTSAACQSPKVAHNVVVVSKNLETGEGTRAAQQRDLVDPRTLWVMHWG